MELRILYLSEYVCILSALKRKVSGDEHVQENTQRPNICLGSITLVQNLWCHVERRSCHCVHHLALLLDFRQPEVDQLDIIFFSNHNVLRLDVSVDHIRRVAVINCFE